MINIHTLYSHLGHIHSKLFTLLDLFTAIYSQFNIVDSPIRALPFTMLQLACVRGVKYLCFCETTRTHACCSKHVTQRFRTPTGRHPTWWPSLWSGCTSASWRGARSPACTSTAPTPWFILAQTGNASSLSKMARSQAIVPLWHPRWPLCLLDRRRFRLPFHRSRL